MGSASAPRCVLLAALTAACLLLPACGPRTPKAHYERGMKRMAAKDYRGAWIDFLNAVKGDADFRDAHYQLGIAAITLKQAPAAYRAWATAEKLDDGNQPYSIDLRLRLGLLLLENRNYEEVQQKANWILSRDPQNAQARELLAFVRRMIALRQEHPVLRRRRFFQGRRLHGSEVKDIAWFNPDGKEMSEEEWNQGFVRSLGMRLAGDAIDETDVRGQTIMGDTLLVLLNAHHEPLPFTLPAHKRGVRWERLLDTARPAQGERTSPLKGGARYDLGARSLAVLRLRRPPGREPRQGPQASPNGPAAA